MRRRGQPSTVLITKINVTPIIDVALVLVIILLVTAPMLSVADLGVNLPLAHTREAEDERNVSVTMGTDGEFAVDDIVIHRDQLRAVLAAKLAVPGNDHVLVVVRADSGAPYGVVRGLLEDARAAGATRIAIATRQKVDGR